MAIIKSKTLDKYHSEKVAEKKLPKIKKTEYSHHELCKVTAEKFIKDSDVVLYDYQTTVSDEHPDVLTYSGTTKIYEIKVSRADFLRDAHKPCRLKKKLKHSYWRFEENKLGKIIGVSEKPSINRAIEPIYEQAPHLGRYRYYVCPEGLINADEIKNGFGLYWVKNDRFYKQKDSEKFRNDMRLEQILLLHALRTAVNGGRGMSLILVRPYK